MTKHLTITAFLFAIGATLFWAGNAVVGKLLADSIPAFSLNFCRWLLAFIILFPFAIRNLNKQKQLLWQQKGLITLLAILSISLYNSFQYIALHETSPGNVGIMTATMPIFILLLSSWINGTTIHRNDVLGILLAVVGISFIVLADQSNATGVNFGDLIMLIAVLAFALYSVLLKRVSTLISTPSLLLVLIGIGTLFSFPFYYWDLSQGNEIQWLKGNNPWLILYIAIFPAIASYFLWNLAIKKGGPIVTGLSINMLPVFALILSAIFLNTGVELSQVLAMVLVLAGTLVSLTSNWLKAARAV